MIKPRKIEYCMYKAHIVAKEYPQIIIHLL